MIEELCTRCAREVEGLRIKEEAKDTYINSLEKVNKQQEVLISGQNVQLSNYAKQAEIYEERDKKKDELLANKDKQLELKDKEIEALKKNKCGFKCQAIRVALGVGIGVALGL